MWHGFYGGGGWWMMGFGMLFWVVVLGVVVWALSRGSFGNWHRRDAEASRDPVGILKERYARGEIDETEYQRVKSQLEGR